MPDTTVTWCIFSHMGLREVFVFVRNFIQCLKISFLQLRSFLSPSRRMGMPWVDWTWSQKAVERMPVKGFWGKDWVQNQCSLTHTFSTLLCVETYFEEKQCSKTTWAALSCQRSTSCQSESFLVLMKGIVVELPGHRQCLSGKGWCI